MSAVHFKNVDIMFGVKSKQAFALLDAGKGRDEIQSQTGCILGAANVNLAVEKGEICVLMGLSGSGKSTVLRAVNGLNQVSRGDLLVEHEGKQVNITNCSEAVLHDVRARTVAMVFQQFALLPWRNVRDNVGFGLELRGMAKAERTKIVDDVLSLVALAKWSEKYAHELSGGMQQRVGLARALASNPDILLMDEPFSALDPLIREKLQNELMELQRNIKKTILFVSHDLDEAMKIGNRIVIMEGGKIVQIGTPQEIVLRPANDYVAEFVKHMNPLNVLQAGSFMKDIRQFTNGKNGVNLELTADGRLKSIAVNGQNLTAVNCTEVKQLPPAPKEKIVCVAPSNLTLRAAIALRQATETPIIITDADGRVIGICQDDEIYAGLLSKPLASSKTGS
ncbi:MAG: choline ABC transporter ATP-binding protein [Alphaproteobacteria bacterium]|nr:choline ABC transporter ATP-binding protein [Alphaproteobacteria bacterium]